MKNKKLMNEICQLAHRPDVNIVSICGVGREKVDYQRTRKGWYDGQYPYREESMNQMLRDEFRRGSEIIITTQEGETIYGRSAA